MIGVCRVWKFRTLALPTPEQPAEATSWVRPARGRAVIYNCAISRCWVLTIGPECSTAIARLRRW